MRLVIKVGGSLIAEPDIFTNIAQDFQIVAAKNQCVLVHGGAKIVNKIAEKMGKEQNFVTSATGFRSRYTDRETMEIFEMVMAGKINKELVTSLQINGINAIGLSGVDGGLIRAQRKDRIKIIDEHGRKRMISGDYTGKINEVDANLLDLLFDNEYVPVVAPIALSHDYEPLNCDGDRTAAYIARAISADKLILLTDVSGLLIDESMVPLLTAAEAKDEIDKIGAGMKKKVFGALEALEGNVKEVIIASGLVDAPISNALEHKGTVVVP
ncbi:MAG: [LysW]-aminoadipate/[LysW]-glutamate kinase [Promethearchaeota archaeon]